MPDDDLDEESIQAPEVESTNAPVSGVETEATRRLLAVARAGGRIADDQRYWDELQYRVEKGTLLQGDVMDEWTREMNRRWRDRQSRQKS